MRIISGDLRGKKLLAPKDETIRPTTDRVKESMFNLIYDYIDEDTVVYDLFSGTGGLGIEALSRGAKRAYFSDKNKDSYNLTKENVKNCRFQDYATLVYGNYKKAISEFDLKSDLVFVDPPYNSNLWKDSSDYLLAQDKLKDGAIVVMEHSVENDLSDIDSKLKLIKERRYGAIVVSIYQYGDLSEEI